MEALGAGANILAFVVLGLNCAKTIYQTLSAIKDAPRIVQQVSTDILQLHYILEQVKQSRAAADDDALARHVRLCVDELKPLATVIEKVQLTPSDVSTGKAWKKLKAFLNEKNLDLISSRVTRHIATLSLRLNTLSSNVTFETRDSSTQLERTVQALGELVQQQIKLQNARFETLNQTFVNYTHNYQDTVRSELRGVQAAVEAVSSLSQDRANTMIDMLQEIKSQAGVALLQQQVAVEASWDKSYLQKTDSSTIASDSDRTPSCSEPRSECENTVKTELVRGIERLCGLIHEKERSFDTFSDDDDEAESIIQDLQMILESTQRNSQLEVISTKPVPPWARGRVHGGDKEFHRNVRRFGREFGRVELGLNQSSLKQKDPRRALKQQDQSYHCVDIGVGTLVVVARKRTTSYGATSTTDCDTSRTRDATEFVMTVSFLPNDAGRFHMLVASTLQQEMSRGSVYSISRLCVNRVLPADSYVFQVVREGRLDELKRMLREGEASTRDHDEYGASLLFYSTSQPEMCKFLVKMGLDVDHLAIDTGAERAPAQGFGGYLCTPLQIDINYHEMEPEYLSRVAQSRRILLEANADPTIGYDMVWPFIVNGSSGPAELIRAAWDPELTGHFANINQPLDESGLQPLLFYCVESSTKDFNVAGVSEFLKLGADINARTPSGQTCLHCCLNRYSKYGLGSDWDSLVALQDALQFLINRGADVKAIDHMGRSVSSIAYRSNHRKELNLVGDLWDSVLDRCDYSIAEFRLGYWRIASYDESYTRSMFEQLWEGREANCPYWDDSPWLLGEERSNSGSEDGLSDIDSESSEWSTTDGEESE